MVDIINKIKNDAKIAFDAMTTEDQTRITDLMNSVQDIIMKGAKETDRLSEVRIKIESVRLSILEWILKDHPIDAIVTLATERAKDLADQ